MPIKLTMNQFDDISQLNTALKNSVVTSIYFGKPYSMIEMTRRREKFEQWTLLLWAGGILYFFAEDAIAVSACFIACFSSCLVISIKLFVVFSHDVAW